MPNDFTNIGSTSCSLSDCPIELSAFRVGQKFGEMVSPEDVESEDPTRFVILTNNDRDRGLPSFEADFSETDADKFSDDDLSRIELTNWDSSLESGVFRIALSNSSAVRLFRQDGTLLEDMSVDLSDPQGDLAALASGETVSIWVEAMQQDSDFIFSFIYEKDEEECCRREVHMLLAHFSLVDASGAEIDFVAAYPKQSLLIYGDVISLPDVQIGPTTKPVFDNEIGPLPESEIFYKIKVDGLPTSIVNSLEVRSTDVTSDYYQDDWDSSSSETVSRDFGVIHWADPGDVLTSSERSALKNNVQINTVHGKSATIDLSTSHDRFIRPLPGVEITPTSPALHPIGGRLAVDFSPETPISLTATGTGIPEADSYSWNVVTEMPSVGFTTSSTGTRDFSITVENLGLWVVEMTYFLSNQAKTVRIYLFVTSPDISVAD